MKKISVLIIFLLIGTTGFSQSLTITNNNKPDRAGERMLDFNCSLDGNAQKDIEVWVYYSTDKNQLSSDNCPRGRASINKIQNDPAKVLCRFYFPHKDQKHPNYILPSEESSGESLSESEMKSYIEATAGSSKYLQLLASITDKNEKVFTNPSRVYYKIVRKKNSVKIQSDVFDFTMPRVFAIGYMGDSFAAGEGAPYNADKKWDDDFCHRSNKSGGMRGINKLIQLHRELAVEVINTTCSGALIGELITESQRKDGKPGAKQPQLDQIEKWCTDNSKSTIDIMLMGIGGNNIGFSYFATAAMQPDKWSTFETEKNTCLQSLESLPEKYSLLNDVLLQQPYQIGKVLIMNYPNMLFGANRELCNGSNTTLSCGVNATSQLYQHINFFRDVLTSLNNAVDKAAENSKWDVIKVSKINRNGLCNCDEPYFNTLENSFWLQQDIDGTIHPNADGYVELYKENVYSSLVSAVKDAQTADLKIRQQETKAELKEMQKKEIAKAIARKKIKEKYKADLAEKEKSSVPRPKINTENIKAPAKVSLKNNDEPETEKEEKK